MFKFRDISIKWQLMFICFLIIPMEILQINVIGISYFTFMDATNAKINVANEANFILIE
jgi:hypothetical protein